MIDSWYPDPEKGTSCPSTGLLSLVSLRFWCMADTPLTLKYDHCAAQLLRIPPKERAVGQPSIVAFCGYFPRSEEHDLKHQVSTKLSDSGPFSIHTGDPGPFQ